MYVGELLSINEQKLTCIRLAFVDAMDNINVPAEQSRTLKLSRHMFVIGMGAYKNVGRCRSYVSQRAVDVNGDGAITVFDMDTM
jgi:hypothetical protein